MVTTISQNCPRWWFGTEKTTCITCANNDPVQRHIFFSSLQNEYWTAGDLFQGWYSLANINHAPICAYNSGADKHYTDAIMGTVASQVTSLTILYTTLYSDADQSKHQSSASLAFVWGIHRGPVNSPHKWPVTRKMFPFDDVIMCKNLSNYDTSNRFGTHTL